MQVSSRSMQLASEVQDLSLEDIPNQGVMVWRLKQVDDSAEFRHPKREPNPNSRLPQKFLL